ncbi:MAG: ABC transporter substrate-binding protein [Lachnospiraceae bacterium]|nr:ABC transporter substrate-binding protein [Lachnospiraceae bacterium]
MKKTHVILLGLTVCLAVFLFGCSSGREPSGGGEGSSLTDSEGKTVMLPKDPRVVCLYGSYSEAWMLAGGEPVGVTEDAGSDHKLDLPQDTAIVGTVKEPNAEVILSLEPDLVILSSDIAAQQDVKQVLENAGLVCVSFRVDTFDEYAFMMEQFCRVTGRQDRYEEYVTRVGERIEAVKARAAERGEDGPDILLIRAYSSGIKAKTDDELAGVILAELGCHNIADDHPSMLEDLSMEEVIRSDPDYIFVTTMGSEEKALTYLDSLIAANPAWQELEAVKNGRNLVLPKALFHYKPNHRWGESYEYLAGILFGEE